MTTDKNKPATNNLFTVDGKMTIAGEGRIDVESTDVEFRLLVSNEMTIGCYQNRNCPSEKHLSFTFSKDITNGTHTLTPAGPFLTANFHEALNNELGIQPPLHYKAIEGTLSLILTGNPPDQIGYVVTAFNLTLQPLTTGKTIELFGKFHAQLTYVTAN